MRHRAKGNPKLAIAYSRVSTEEQRLGPEAQRQAIELWSARGGVSVLAWYVDQGVSGGSELDAREELGKALGALRFHGAGVLVVAKRDRLARDVVIAATIDRAVAARGARVVSADGAGNGDSPAEAFMRQVLDAAAQYERALIRQRTKDALAAKRARGERAGTVPYGFRLVGDGSDRIEEDAAEQAVIARIKERRAAGLSLRSIMRELESAGIRSRVGRPLQAGQVGSLAART